jgi:hypothetical protein
MASRRRKNRVRCVDWEAIKLMEKAMKHGSWPQWVDAIEDHIAANLGVYE